MSFFSGLEFAITVATMTDLPPAAGREVAFAGRSNAGKSSAINTLARKKQLAFVSKTPGRTRHLNFFRNPAGQFLVDLPGYGYARVPAAERERWEGLLEEYLMTRTALCGLVLIMDVRHPLTELDRQMLDWFTPGGRPVHILLTKADKLSRQAATRALAEVSDLLRRDYPGCTVQLFSSLNGLGVQEAERAIGAMLHVSPRTDRATKKKPPVKGE